MNRLIKNEVIDMADLVEDLKDLVTNQQSTIESQMDLIVKLMKDNVQERVRSERLPEV